MTSSFFSRITRYRPSVAVDPAENRLTEAFAVTLEHVDELAAVLVAPWVAEDTLAAARAVQTDAEHKVEEEPS